jgi:hypothetical protein
VEWDAAFGVGLACGDPEPGVSVGVGVQAVELETADLAASRADPAGDEVGRALVGVGQGPDSVFDCGELVCWEVAGNPVDVLGQIQVTEQGRLGTSSQPQARVWRRKTLSTEMVWRRVSRLTGVPVR